MAETLAALLAAHVVADFLLQPRRMVEAKARRHGGALVLHALVVAVATAAALGVTTRDALGAVAVVAVLHLLIDVGKALARPGLAAFLVDQGLHLGVLAAVAAYLPGLRDAGLWAGAAWLPGVLVLGSGAVLAIRAGAFAVDLLLKPWGDVGLEGLPGGGRTIGNLERGLIYLLVLTGQPAAIGFLIAAKSVLRFGSVGNEGRLSEYVIVGTLASFGWAILVSTGTLILLSALAHPGLPLPGGG
jgi:hypothetical protein